VSGGRRRGQSIVEFALIAPLLIILAMAAWDGGSVLRELIVLQQAARDGARADTSAFGGAQTVVANAVLASAADLPALTAQMVSVTSSDAQSVTVQVRYPHALITPVLRQLWGGGTLMLSASATFYVPQLTPTPLSITPSTPTPTATPTVAPTSTATSIAPTATPTSTSTPRPTATPTLTPTVTPTATPVLPNPCSAIPNAQSLPALGNNTGYWCTVRTTTSSVIVGNWQDNNGPNNQILIYLDNPNPFVGQPDPSLLDPNKISATNLAVSFRTSDNVLWGGTSSCADPDTYSVYFYNRGNAFPASTGNVSTFSCT
jgi:Flp pilus assembly protein TadG